MGPSMIPHLPKRDLNYGPYFGLQRCYNGLIRIPNLGPILGTRGGLAKPAADF